MNKQQILDLIFEEKVDELNVILDTITKEDINFVDEKLNITPLICAIDTNNIVIVGMILSKGANPNFCKQGLSLPLIHAIEISVEAEDYNESIHELSTKIIELLIEYGADVNLKNYNGKTAFSFAKNYHMPAYRLFEKMNKQI